MVGQQKHILTRRHVFLFNKKMCPLAGQEDMISRWTGRHIVVSTKKTCLLAVQEYVYSCRTLDKKTCLPVEEEGMPSCPTRRHAFLLNKRARLLAKQEKHDEILIVANCKLHDHRVKLTFHCNNLKHHHARRGLLRQTGRRICRVCVLRVPPPPHPCP